MEQVVLFIHLALALALVVTVLLQQSEGGALGIGGGNNGGGLVSSRSAANLLTRMTAIFATAFMCTSILLAILAGQDESGESILDSVPAIEQPAAPAPSNEPSVPLSE